VIPVSPDAPARAHLDERDPIAAELACGQPTAVIPLSSARPRQLRRNGDNPGAVAAPTGAGERCASDVDRLRCVAEQAQACLHPHDLRLCRLHRR
jgi:hypothetical protein